MMIIIQIYFYRDEPNDTDITESESFKFKSKFLVNTAGIINAKIVVQFKNLINIWRTLGLPLTDCVINLILNWSANCVISKGDRAATFEITDTKFYVPIVTLSFQNNKKLLQ